ncbi:MAG TPA: hypothetical protein VJK03_01720 [Candidatus Nanoarchaeia archaeon]|nr:hypothetical protein [Candidatus Nanoarchaeia archaeon]
MSFFFFYADTIVIILQSPEVLAVEIVNKSIADSFKAYFEEFWKEAKAMKKVDWK